MAQRSISVTILFSIIFGSVIAQNRVFDRPENINRSFYFDDGGGNFLIAKALKFSWDSTQYHLVRSNADHELTSISGLRFPSGLTWLNHAAKVDNGVIMAGADLSNYTRPMALRMDTTGIVDWCIYFDQTDLYSGQYQIHSTFVEGNDLDMFTWADNTRPIFNMLNGNIDGTNWTGVEFVAPDTMEFRVDDVVPMAAANSYYVITQSEWDSHNTHLTLLGVDPTGVVWAKNYLHGSAWNLLEFAYGLMATIDGGFIHCVGYYEPDLKYRMVKTDVTGELLWAREYFESGEQLLVGAPYETSDGGLLFTASSSTALFALKTNAGGIVQWSKKYEQNLTTSSPIGWFFKVGNEILSYRNSTVSKVDEDLNVCDFIPHTGITSTLVTPTITTANITSIQRTHNELPYTYSYRSSTFENTQSCIYTGVEEQDVQSLRIYPNPAYDVLNIEYPETVKTLNYEVIDLSGRILTSGEWQRSDNFRLGISNLKNGVYAIRISTSNSSITVRFIKE